MAWELRRRFCPSILLVRLVEPGSGGRPLPVWIWRPGIRSHRNTCRHWRRHRRRRVKVRRRRRQQGHWPWVRHLRELFERASDLKGRARVQSTVRQKNLAPSILGRSFQKEKLTNKGRDSNLKWLVTNWCTRPTVGTLPR